MLRAAGWPAVVGALLLGLSIFGLGDLLTPFEREGCRLADAGCTETAQVATTGGVLDGVLSLAGLIALVAAGFFIAAAMKRLPAWRAWVWPTRWGSAAMLLLILFFVATSGGAPGGLVERLVALAGAVAISALAVGVKIRVVRSVDSGVVTS